ncbi:ubiquinol-cytochrome C reductase [Aspergillus ambiguus]|uniref:cytochrome b-c1 complex subunit 9 n=1 Tax=Aspergillus ambiguus TaxID=176160 RepID=UPI003CCDCD02
MLAGVFGGRSSGRPISGRLIPAAFRNFLPVPARNFNFIPIIIPFLPPTVASRLLLLSPPDSSSSQWPVLGLIRRNAVYLTTIFASAFAFEITYDTASNKIWDAMNRGRQWKDIKHRYMVQEEEDDE